MGELDGPQSIHDFFRENLTVSILKSLLFIFKAFRKWLKMSNSNTNPTQNLTGIQKNIKNLDI